MKELKDWEGELIRADLSVEWNPVKELKGSRDALSPPRSGTNVESGEGIESLSPKGPLWHGRGPPWNPVKELKVIYPLLSE